MKNCIQHIFKIIQQKIYTIYITYKLSLFKLKIFFLFKLRLKNFELVHSTFTKQFQGNQHVCAHVRTPVCVRV